ncbi:hypothetical protein [Histidinibacterium aquaticum]|uniref:Uncharacterized protein n=1 Tax=Histidinibacterium aquaticum TaxID=2613962 RepID=A0A5J5GDE8_9RHOB|nr:hypothetical protein [Histidinibacterium aquaticum]KAA9006057.1 hypothetical protein F3S47_16015 [Histidinibacterium aquaticum]
MADRKQPAEVGAQFTGPALDERITVHEGAQVIEIDYTGLYIHSSAEANAFYDRIEARILETGEPLWFFCVDTTDYRVDRAAWFAYSRRGTDLHEAHSMGTVRVDRNAGPQIERAKGTERENPNLFASRDEAMAALRARPSQRRTRLAHTPNYERGAFLRRIRPDRATEIMEIDLSGISFEHSRDVNDIFNWIEEVVRGTGRRWYFLYNYEGTRIQQPAWLTYSLRAEALRDRWSLGSVRYAAGSETERDIRLRAENRTVRPNIRNTRAEALERIAEMKAGR